MAYSIYTYLRRILKDTFRNFIKKIANEIRTFFGKSRLI